MTDGCVVLLAQNDWAGTIFICLNGSLNHYDILA